MDYKEYAKETETPLPTGIHTRISKERRLSSCFRRFANAYFEGWGWETFLWNGDRIEQEYDILTNAERVIDLHIHTLNEQKEE